MVRKSSPLGRKPRSKTTATGAAGGDAAAEPGAAVDQGVGGVPAAVDEPDADAAAAAVSADTESPTEAASADAPPSPVVDDSGQTGSYRDRRVDAQRRRSAREAAATAPRSTVDGARAKRLIAAVLGVLILVGGTIASIFFGTQYHRISTERALRAEYATFARQVVVQMTTLNAENADEMYKLAMEKTSGRAQQVFRDNMKQVTDMIRKGDAVTKTTVLVDAVSKAEPDDGTVLMVVGWESRSKDGKAEPLFQTFRYRVGVTRINDELKLTDLEFVW